MPTYRLLHIPSPAFPPSKFRIPHMAQGRPSEQSCATIQKKWKIQMHELRSDMSLLLRGIHKQSEKKRRRQVNEEDLAMRKTCVQGDGVRLASSNGMSSQTAVRPACPQNDCSQLTSNYQIGVAHGSWRRKPWMQKDYAPGFVDQFCKRSSGSVARVSSRAQDCGPRD